MLNRASELAGPCEHDYELRVPLRQGVSWLAK
jgi:hypothetical protein